MDRRPNTQDIAWFLDQNRMERLDLDPPYQRKSVWTPKDRKFFLDTIFRNYPCPPIFLYREIKDDGTAIYHVVDGKQRLETILRFTSDEITLADDFGDITYDGKKFSQLNSMQKKDFWNYLFSVEFINIKEGQTINEIFDRVNRNARNLKPQELRHARFSGWFINYIETESEDDFWDKIKISTKAREKRMLDMQFISEVILISLDNEIVGFDQNFLDAKYAEYDTVNEDEEEGIDTEELNNKIKKTKKYISKIEELNGCITKYSKNFGDFYVLWALISLNEHLTEESIFAEKYAEFMELVNITKKGTPTQNEHVNQYIQNSIGAVTDLSKRQARLESLKAYIL